MKDPLFKQLFHYPVLFQFSSIDLFLLQLNSTLVLIIFAFLKFFMNETFQRQSFQKPTLKIINVCKIE